MKLTEKKMQLILQQIKTHYICSEKLAYLYSKMYYFFQNITPMFYMNYIS